MERGRADRGAVALDALTRRGEKKGIYERNGVREYWTVDALRREITVFVLEDGAYGVGRVYREGERVPSEILQGLEEDVGALVVGGQEGVRSDT